MIVLPILFVFLCVYMVLRNSKVEKDLNYKLRSWEHYDQCQQINRECRIYTLQHKRAVLKSICRHHKRLKRVGGYNV